PRRPMPTLFPYATLFRSAGLSPESALEVLMDSPAYSRIMDAKGPKKVLGNFEPQARLAQHVKDVRLILDEAARGGQALPLSQVRSEEHTSELQSRENLVC